MEPFSSQTIARAQALHRLAKIPLPANILEQLAGSEYPVEESIRALGHIYRRNDCKGIVEERLQGAGINSEADAIAFMDELEPKLLRWQAEMLEVSARARADVRARAEAFAKAPL
jgi:hypothetical protein